MIEQRTLPSLWLVVVHDVNRSERRIYCAIEQKILASSRELVAVYFCLTRNVSSSELVARNTPCK